jgi:hypothetical protein
MYIFSLVGPVREVIESLAGEHGDYKLVMLYNNDLGATTNWNLIVSSDWTDDLGIAEATKIIAQALHGALAQENKASISRVTVLKTTDPFVRDMTRLYPVLNGEGVPLKQVTAGDVREGAGFVFCSRPGVPA